MVAVETMWVAPDGSELDSGQFLLSVIIIRTVFSRLTKADGHFVRNDGKMLVRNLTKFIKLLLRYRYHFRSIDMIETNDFHEGRAFSSVRLHTLCVV